MNPRDKKKIRDLLHEYLEENMNQEGFLNPTMVTADDFMLYMDQVSEAEDVNRKTTLHHFNRVHAEDEFSKLPEPLPTSGWGTTDFLLGAVDHVDPILEEDIVTVYFQKSGWYITFQREDLEELFRQFVQNS